jgi:hypothetical protein
MALVHLTSGAWGYNLCLTRLNRDGDLTLLSSEANIGRPFQKQANYESISQLYTYFSENDLMILQQKGCSKVRNTPTI